jgi:hypothetical protein
MHNPENFIFTLANALFGIPKLGTHESLFIMEIKKTPWIDLRDET